MNSVSAVSRQKSWSIYKVLTVWGEATFQYEIKMRSSLMQRLMNKAQISG